MTLTADSFSDSISILGRYGAITHESAGPDKVLIDVDLATLAGLEIDGDNLLKAKVDGSTIKINNSGALESLLTQVSNLPDLADVSLTTPLANDQLLVFDGSSWTDLSASLTGDTRTPAQPSTTALSDVTPTTTYVAEAGHNHYVTTKGAALQSHTHKDPIQGAVMDPPTQSGVSVLYKIGNAIGTIAQTANSISSTANPNSVNNVNHTHPKTGLGITIA